VLSPKRKAILGLTAGFLLSLLLVIAFSPHFHDSQGGVRQNESAAVGSLRKIHDLQSKYAAAHPKEGFACQLQRLRLPTTLLRLYWQESGAATRLSLLDALRRKKESLSVIK